jgi:mono/diheme cytochrome c family protein
MLRFRAVKETIARALGLAVPPLLLGLLGAGASACDQAPSADSLPEWKPADHHSADDNGGATSGQQAAPATAGKGGETAQLVDMAWRQQCTQCHGPMGRGDGQMGAMLHARDLTDPDWQSKVTDADIAAVIRTGKNKMPKYDLPDPVLQGLIARIRQLKGG